MSKTPLVSVCVIVFNHESYLRDCFDGIKSQKLIGGIEVVIGEDSSSDGSLKICEEFKSSSAWHVSLLKRPQNLGMLSNWADTINSAKGKYVAIVEGDDYWIDPLKLQKQVDFLEGHPNYSFCYHAFEVLNERDAGMDVSYLYRKNVAPPKNTCELPYYMINKNVKTLTLMFRASAITQQEVNQILLESPMPFSGDIPLVMLLLSKGPGHFLDEKMGVYRLHDNGITMNTSDERRNRGDSALITNLKLYSRLTDFADRSFVKTKLRSALTECIHAGEFKLAIRILRTLTGT